MNYSEKLKDPRWQKKRLEILERDGWKCMGCGDKEKTLHVHHIFYFPGRDPWDIENGFLITFCEECHNPNQCQGLRCEDCQDSILNDGDCEGSDHPKSIRIAISSLLDAIWRTDKIGDYLTALGLINSKVR